MKFVIATQNQGKLKEFKRILTPLGIEVLSQKEAGVDLDVEETGTTFRENAFLKADAVCKASGLPAIADDSGLCVDYLSGAPGVYSARYAGEGASDDKCIAKLLQALDGVPKSERGAHFACHICAVFPDGGRLDAEGRCMGAIGYEKRGDGGFGYDPVFMVEDRSFSELSDSEKDAVSHRGRALRVFLDELKTYINETKS
ncbi:XTP/dITP diphosphatase [Candidatus Soleaferrea massiliensis]|uniref:XTP/dITP diphosphatase n=1 Tax=Candidatus Soleaferrea massiliensis TaxID=1470354 RepID=UPI00058C6938|nr:XTP/dITP diphosphatase [Candidatus Soleaferrea massiliensis]